MSQAASISPPSGPPFLACGWYFTWNLAKLRVTFSVSLSSPPEPPVETDVINTSVKVILQYSRGLSPALRTTSSALGKCLPLQPYWMRLGVDLSIHFVNEKSWTMTLPAPPPTPTCVSPEFAMAQLQARTSISPLCLASPDSPLRSPILMNMSTAMRSSLNPCWGHSEIISSARAAC